MIRVLEIVSDSNIGGAGIWIRNYAAGYSSNAIELAVALPRGAALTPLLEQCGCRVIECDMEPDRSMSMRSVNVLRNVIAAFRPQVVHTHGSLAGRIAAKSCGIYTIYTKHTLSPVAKGIRKSVRGSLDNALADCVIACSACARDNLIANGVAPGKIEVVYNGCEDAPVFSEEERRARRAALGIRPEDIVFSIVARLAPIKDHDTLLRAAAKAALPQAKYLIVGGGECEEKLKARAAELGIAEQCIFTGQLPGARDIYPLVEANVLCSLSENMPISLVESMAAARPCIASRVGGMEEVARNGKTALMFRAGDDEMLAAHLRRLYEEPELREKLGSAGRARFLEKFTLGRCVAETEKIYGRIGGYQNGQE